MNINPALYYPIGITFAICLISLVMYNHWSLTINETKEALRTLTKSLNEPNFSGIEALTYSIDTTKDPHLKDLLSETKNSLIAVEGDLGTEFFSMRGYSEIWTARGVVSGRINLSLFETMPNLLIGAGLMFTFIFLALALNDAGMAMGGNDQRDKALQDLIANAGGKFITSIAGLFCSLAWNMKAKVTLDELQGCMYELQAALRKAAPDTAAQAVVKSQHTIFKELLQESREQVGQLRRFETDIAVAIAKAIGSALQPSFKELGAELRDAINQLSEKIGNMNEDALAKMIEQFLAEFRSTSSNEMNEFKTVLANLARNLENAGITIGTQVGAAGESFGTAAGLLEQSITKANEAVIRFDSSMDKAGNVVTEGSDRFETISDKLLSNIRGVDALLDGIESFVEKIQTNVGMLNNIADTLDDAVQAQKNVSNEFKTGIPQMSSALKDAVTGITESTQASALAITGIREELDRTKIAVDQTVNSLTTGVDQYTEKVKDLHLLLDEKIGDAISKIGGTISTLEDTMDEFVEALPRK